MTRTDDDTWDINESVGATALGVASGRAAETNSADPLINDPYARLFLEAAGDGIWKIYLDGEPPAELAEVDPRFSVEELLASNNRSIPRTSAMASLTACSWKPNSPSPGRRPARAERVQDGIRVSRAVRTFHR